MESYETEILELRLFNTKRSIEQELEKDDGLTFTKTPLNQNIDAERLMTENETLRNQLKQEKDRAQMMNLNERSLLDIRLKEKENEILEMEKQATTQKRKYQKLCEEMQDIQRMCDQSKVRNRELEKLQQKFDSEMSSLKAKLEEEREAREKSERERDTARYEVFAVSSELDAQKMESAHLTGKCERLNKDLKEYESATGAHYASSFTQNSAEFMKLKSQVREMESKLREQEEELDDQQGEIQQLEQTKLRLEMQLEKDKQKWLREVAEKESEMDDLRFHTQKKIKSIEMQLEEESEACNALQREKRELERKLRETTSSGGKRSSGQTNGHLPLHNQAVLADYVAKLKRQMIKYKTIAYDAQTQLEKLRENIPKQSIMKSLKAQLEDSEISKANVMKAKQLMQVEVDDVQQQLEDANALKQHVIIKALKTFSKISKIFSVFFKT